MASRDLINKLKGYKATSNGSTPRFRQGRYELIVKKVAFPTTEMSGDTFIGEFYIEKAEAIPGELQKDNVTPAEPNPAGSTVGFAIVPNANPKMREQLAGDIRRFIETLDGAAYPNDADGDNAYADALFAYVNEDPNATDAKGEKLPVNPARGFKIIVEATGKKDKATGKNKLIESGKNAGEVFINLSWTHVPLTPEQVKANIDSGKV